MTPPFTRAEFFRVLVEYNETVWPAQVLLFALAAAVVVAVVRGDERFDRAATLVLGAFWIWMGAAYHWAFFTDINPAAWAFGGAFVVEGLLLGVFALRSDPLRYGPGLDAYGIVGGALVGYALVVYPLLGLALGHVYPEQPTFGLPCPTTIFTFGLLLWARPRVSWTLLVVPVVWALIGGSAAPLFGVLEDVALPVSAVLGGGLLLWRNRRADAGGDPGARGGAVDRSEAIPTG